MEFNEDGFKALLESVSKLTASVEAVKSDNEALTGKLSEAEKRADYLESESKKAYEKRDSTKRQTDETLSEYKQRMKELQDKEEEAKERLASIEAEYAQKETQLMRDTAIREKLLSLGVPSDLRLETAFNELRKSEKLKWGEKNEIVESEELFSSFIESNPFLVEQRKGLPKIPGANSNRPQGLDSYLNKDNTLNRSAAAEAFAGILESKK